MTVNKSYLLGIYTKSPLHVGAGTSVDIVDMPITRERITNYPVIPGSAIKGVLRQQARDCGIETDKQNQLFGNEDNTSDAFGGAMSFGEAKLLAWPVRSLKGCFAWVTCPLALQRFARDTKKQLKIPFVETDACFAPE
ncbi:MAG: type III-B CRISPR module RAMP protein Cmr4, partial [Kiritimatiellae bacterium]|nr:type III-B CRISPR module RAMP protein Cmr4 [Kiritimatiellia bacterium]